MLTKYRYLLLFIIGCLSARGQHTVTVYFDGDWGKSSRAGAEYYRIMQVDKANKPIGLVRDYFISGKLQFVGKLLQLDPEIIDSTCTWYYEEGGILQQATYNKGMLNGWLRVYHENGKVCIALEYKNGVAQNNFIQFYNTGQVYEKREYLNHGDTVPFKQYFEDGTLMATGAYRRGKNGNLTDVRLYDTTYTNNLHKAYSVSINTLGPGAGYYRLYGNGGLLEEKKYLNGLQEGWEKTYNDGGILTSQTFYREGKKDSLEETFSNGKLITHHEYKNFKPVGEWVNYSANNLYQRSIFKGDTAFQFFYYPTGQLRQKYIQLNNTEIGKDTSWYNNGDVQHIRTIIGDNSIDTFFYTGHRISRIYYPGTESGAEGNKDYDTIGNLISFTAGWRERLRIKKDNLQCLYGLKAPDGKWFVKPSYTAITENNGYLYIYNDDKVGLITVLGKTILPVAYTEIFNLSEATNYTEPVSVFYADSVMATRAPLPTDLHKFDFFIVKQDTLEGLVTSSGYRILPVACKNIWVNIKDSIIRYQHGNAYGIIHLPSFIKTEKEDTFITDFKYGNLYTFRSNQTINKHPNSFYNGGLHDGYWGLMTNTGKVILPDTFAIVTAQYLSSGIIGFGNEGYTSFGLMDTSGKILLPPHYDLYIQTNASTDLFNTGFLVMKDQHHYGLFNKYGQQLLPLIYDSIEVLLNRNGYFILRLTKGGKMGIYTSTTGLIVPINFNAIWPCQLNTNISFNAYAARNKKGIAIYDSAGKKMPGLYRQVQFVQVKVNNIRLAAALVYDGKSVILKGMHNETLDLKNADMLDNGIGIFFTVDGDIFFNQQGKVLYTAHVAHVQERFKHGRFLMADTAGHRFIIGTISYKPLYLNYTDINDPLANGMRVVKAPSGMFGIIDSNFVPLVNTVWNSILIDAANNGQLKHIWVRDTIKLADSTNSDAVGDDNNSATQLEGGWLLMDNAFKIKFNKPCMWPASFRNGLAIVQTNEGYEMIDEDGKNALPGIYQSIITVDDNKLYQLQQHNKYGLMDTNYTWLTPVKWDKIYQVNDNYIATGIGDTLYVLDKQGNAIIKGEYDFVYGAHDLANMFKTDNAIQNNTSVDSANINVTDVEVNFLFYQHLLDPDEVTETYSDGSTLPGRLYCNVENEAPDTYMHCQSSTETTWTIMDATPYTFSVIKTTTHCDGCYHVYCGTTAEYGNYYMAKKEILPVILDSMLIINPVAALEINEWMKDEIGKLEDVELDCHNIEEYFNTYGKQFSIGQKGLTFYLAPAQNDNYANQTATPQITIPYTKLRKYFRPKSILKNM